jgi:hypothetical protein
VLLNKGLRYLEKNLKKMDYHARAFGSRFR